MGPFTLATAGPVWVDIASQRGEDVEDESAAWSGGVQGLVQALEAHTVPAERADDLDQVGQGPGQPVEARDHQGVAGPQVVQAGRQLGTVGVLARQLVGEDTDAADLGQGVLLAVQQLPGSADPCVADQRAGPDGRLRGQKVTEGFGHTRDCRRNGVRWIDRHAGFATRFITVTGQRGCDLRR